MITEKDTIKCEAVYNEDKTHRLLWKRVWNKEKPTACVIMINPCQADTVLTDTTTYLVVNNIARLGDFGGVTIVNLFSLLTPKLHFRMEIDVNDYSNDQYIKKAADEASVVIAFSEGKRLDDIQKQREIGKRPYQKILLVIGSALITFVVCVVIGFLMHFFLN